MAAWTARVGEFAARVDTAEHGRLRVRYEDKEAIAAFHWRGAPDEAAASVAVREIAERAEAEGFVVHWGRKVLEVRPPVTLDKSLGVSALLGGSRDAKAAPRVDAALYVGDDTTDLDAFRGLRELRDTGVLRSTICVGVSSEETPEELRAQADLMIAGTDGVRELLEALL